MIRLRWVFLLGIVALGYWLYFPRLWHAITETTWISASYSIEHSIKNDAYGLIDPEALDAWLMDYQKRHPNFFTLDFADLHQGLGASFAIRSCRIARRIPFGIVVRAEALRPTLRFNDEWADATGKRFQLSEDIEGVFTHVKGEAEAWQGTIWPLYIKMMDFFEAMELPLRVEEVRHSKGRLDVKLEGRVQLVFDGDYLAEELVSFKKFYLQWLSNYNRMERLHVDLRYKNAASFKRMK